MPRIYVGTYKKYNSGNLCGMWMDLEDCNGREDFLAKCAVLHKDERDPEFMFQDYDGIPREFYSESCIKPELFDWLALDADDRELLEVYCGHISCGIASIDEARDAFMGKADTKAAWAEEWITDTDSEWHKVPEHLKPYFDFEAYARDAEVTFVRVNGDLWVFSS